MNDLTPQEAMSQAKAIAKSAAYGAINYNEAKAQCKPLLAIVNTKGKEVAKKYKKSHHNITFAGLGR